jgi:hypothetical protein
VCRTVRSMAAELACPQIVSSSSAILKLALALRASARQPANKRAPIMLHQPT